MGIGRRDRGVTIFDRGFDAKWIVGSGFARVANGLICGQLESLRKRNDLGRDARRSWKICNVSRCLDGWKKQDVLSRT